MLPCACSGNTETVAGYIAEATGLEAVDIADLDGDGVAAYDGLIVGAPTWHTGADSERSGTAWDDFIYGDLASLDLSGKKVAIFGLGDSSGYSDNVRAQAEPSRAQPKRARGRDNKWALPRADLLLRSTHTRARPATHVPR